MAGGLGKGLPNTSSRANRNLLAGSSWQEADPSRVPNGDDSAEEATMGPDEAERVRNGGVLPSRSFDEASADLVEAVANELVSRRLSLAVSESCTGGLLAKLITDRAGSSAYFRGGVVAYANDLKSKILGVESSVLDAEGAVSIPVAEAMARGVAECLGAEVGVGITGIAGPGGGTDEKPVGTVCSGVALHGRVVAWRSVFSGDRGAIRGRATQEALRRLLEVILGDP